MRLATILLLSSSILLVTCSAEKPEVEKAEGKTRPFLVLCFDVEDYTSPESAGMDEIPKWLAETMTDVGATGSFFVIGEKARSLEARGRRDVIEAMARHDVGSHTSLGSIHPTVTEILEHASFEAGEETMLENEGAGLKVAPWRWSFAARTPIDRIAVAETDSSEMRPSIHLNTTTLRSSGTPSTARLVTELPARFLIGSGTTRSVSRERASIHISSDST